MTQTAVHQEKHQFQAEVQQLLHIVTHALYSNREIFLRELISNAADAIDKHRFLVLSDPTLHEGSQTEEEPYAIRIEINKQERTLTITDNGIGMSRAEVIENLGKIAQSGTRTFLAQLSGDQRKNANLIGQFGVGFYSVFIIADQVVVWTKRAGLSQDQGVRWDSTGSGEYTIETVNKPTRGTQITLFLKKSIPEGADKPSEDEFLERWRLQGIINKYSDYLNIPIQMLKQEEVKQEDSTQSEDQTSQQWETVNRVTALWTLPKNKATDEQYKEFYKHISHDFEEPLTWTQHKVEGGQLEYTCLLFLPRHLPIDFWHHDKQQGLKLYIQRVFILDQVQQFLPHYLRFVRGIIDTAALPLNISREMLQDHPLLSKLRSALTKHMLDLLERMAHDDSEKYQHFWQECGMVLKEGPAEDFTNRQRIAKLLRFATTHADSPSQTVSLADYITRMPFKQKKIYYITADNFNAAKASPHLEVFRKHHVEVLLLSDRIDEWLVGHLTEFDGKPLQSVAKGELDWQEFTGEEPVEHTTTPDAPEKQPQLDGLLKTVQTVLAAHIKEVRFSKRLIASPACLVRDAHALGPQMERLLKAAGQAVTEIKPILELNADHHIVQYLQNEADPKRQEEGIYLLYEQALLAEGGSLPDPATFIKRVNDLWLTAVHGSEDTGPKAGDR